LSFDIPVADWVRRAQEGDVRAFEQLFQQYHRGIYNTIYQMTHNDADAADLTQEVFVRAYRALPRLQTPEAFTSWLYRIAVNLSRNWLRDRGRVRVESLELPGEEGEEGNTREIADPSGDPAALIQTRDMQERVQKAIAGLSPDHRQVVTLHHLEGMPVEEIARVMGCSIGTVKSRLSRARENLKRKLAGYVEG
jgi:RNA polymerase sigma-70 factor (ECF subfamily)